MYIESKIPIYYPIAIVFETEKEVREYMEITGCYASPSKESITYKIYKTLKERGF